MPQCPKCGSEHETESGVKIHYGRAHDGSIAGVEVSCSVCGQTFRKRPANINTERHFCSVECKSEGYKDRVTVTCDYCGESFERRRSHTDDGKRTFCSHECKGLASRDRIEVSCENCDRAIQRRRLDVNQYETLYCSESCRAEHMRGMADPKWNGGATLHEMLLRELAGKRWKDVRRQIEEQRDPVCRLCGRKNSRNGRSLQLHHIVPIMAGGTHHPDNLMFLCHRCHRSTDAKLNEIISYPLTEAVRRATNNT